MLVNMIIAGLLAALQAQPAPPTSVTCSVRGDPAGRVYRLWKASDGGTKGHPAEAGSHEAAGSHEGVRSVEGAESTRASTPDSRAGGGSWHIALRARGNPAWIELALPGAAPVMTDTTASLSYTNANGGRHVKLDVGPGRAELDVWVDHGLEVNVDPNLDPRVDELTTGGTLTSLDCTIGK